MTFGDAKQVGLEAINKMIELKHITVNKYITLDGLAAIIANKLWEVEEENKKNENISQMFTTMEKYFNTEFQSFIKKISK